MSSAIPSAKYSCSGSQLMFGTATPRSTAFRATAALAGWCRRLGRGPASRTLKTRTGRAMFFTCCSPRSSNPKSSLSRLVVHRLRDADPAGLGHRLQSRGDVDPVAENVVASTITSPRLMPMRKSMRLSAGRRRCVRPCRAASRPRSAPHRRRSRTRPACRRRWS